MSGRANRNGHLLLLLVVCDSFSRLFSSFTAKNELLLAKVQRSVTFTNSFATTTVVYQGDLTRAQPLQTKEQTESSQVLFVLPDLMTTTFYSSDYEYFEYDSFW